MVWDPRGKNAGPVSSNPESPAEPLRTADAGLSPTDADAPTVMTSARPAPVLPAMSRGHPLGPLRAGYGPARQLQPPLMNTGLPRFAPVPGYGGTGAAPPLAGADDAQDATSLGLDPATAAGLSYLGWWFTGLLIYFGERHNRFVRFHALQSIVYTGGLSVVSVLAYMIPALLNDAYDATHQHVYATLAMGSALLLFLFVFAAWLTPLIAAWTGHWLRIPFIAPYAERYCAPEGADAGISVGV